MEKSLTTTSPPSLPELFGGRARLSVRQRKRWMEILFSWESKNSYVVYDENSIPVFKVEEQGRGIGKLLLRLILRQLRPFRVSVEDLQSSRCVLKLRRPFRFYFHRLEVTGAEGERLGAIERKWTWLRRRYVVEGSNGAEMATLLGPIFKPWTFQIKAPNGEAQLGVIQKKWSGLAKEMFTEADNFWVEMGAVEDSRLRALLFSAIVLIDIVHFERK